MGFLENLFLNIKIGIKYDVDFVKYHRLGKKGTIPIEENIEGKVVVITGGSLGIGKASAKEFAKRGAIVVIGDVDLENGHKTVQEIQRETGNANVKLLKLDLSDMGSVEEFAEKVSSEYPKIKILLNNAGIGGSSAENIKTKDGFNLHVAVNYMGHFLLTNLLLENLQAEIKSRVVSISSGLQLFAQFDLDDLNMDKSGFGPNNSLPYKNTKFCNALFSKELGRRMSGTGINTYALCPGFVNTTILVKNFDTFMRTLFGVMKIFTISPNKAANEFVIHCALDKNIENETGKMYQFRKHFKAVNKRLDDGLAGALWEKSAELLNLQERLERQSNTLHRKSVPQNNQS